jgi:hypothetical protein
MFGLSFCEVKTSEKIWLRKEYHVRANNFIKLCDYFKGIVQPFELGGEIRCKILEARQVFQKNFNDTISREEHKTIFSGLRITEIILSNQSHFPRFFTPRKMTYRGLTNSGL